MDVDCGGKVDCVEAVDCREAETCVETDDGERQWTFAVEKVG